MNFFSTKPRVLRPSISFFEVDARKKPRLHYDVFKRKVLEMFQLLTYSQVMEIELLREVKKPLWKLTFKSDLLQTNETDWEKTLAKVMLRSALLAAALKKLGLYRSHELKDCEKFPNSLDLCLSGCLETEQKI